LSLAGAQSLAHTRLFGAAILLREPGQCGFSGISIASATLLPTVRPSKKNKSNAGIPVKVCGHFEPEVL
jgi:hypothetical protein